MLLSFPSGIKQDVTIRETQKNQLKLYGYNISTSIRLRINLMQKNKSSILWATGSQS